MLTLNSVSHRLGDNLLFENLTLTINREDRIGVIGPNGSGKSTLLDIMSGVLEPDRGTRLLAPAVRIGYLRQGTLDVASGTLGQALDAPTEGFFGRHASLEAATSSLSTSNTGTAEPIERWERTQDAFEAVGGYEMLDRLEALLDRFGIPAGALHQPLSRLSGGERTRAGLAALLAMQPDVLLLDEPTNHLDLSGQRWLIGFIREYAGAVVVVSHDRAFLDDFATRTIAFESGSTDVRLHAGGYSDFVAMREKERSAELETYKRQQEKIAGLQASIDQDERSARKIESETIDFHYRKRAQKVARAATVRRARIERMLESEDIVDKPSQTWGLALDFPEPTSQARDVTRLDEILVKRGENVILDRVSLELRYGERVALMGDNGAGKTTLLQVISGDLTPDSGYRRMAPGVRIGTVTQDQETLSPELTVMQTVQEHTTISESDLRAQLHRYLFGGDSVHRSVRDLSWGERSRLMLATIAIPGADLLLLDEPTNHLDVDAREAFEDGLTAFPGTVLMVGHDRYAIARIATRIIRIHHGKLHDVDPATDPEFLSTGRDSEGLPQQSQGGT